MDLNTIVESVETAVSLPWTATYDFAEHHSPSSVVINAIRSQITNFF
jgi:UDP-N-acetylglucosamine 2-epimerase (non-hydrolysing)